MGTLDRYQKTGGFVQLLQLIETCGPAKQEKFLNMVKDEDPRWSEAIEKKMLTMEKILAFSDEAISEIAGALQELTLATAFHGMKAEERQRFYRSFNHVQRRKIDDLFETHHPGPLDIGAAYIKILTEVRRLMHDGVLRSDKIDPELFVEDDIEENLRRGADMTVIKAMLELVPSPAQRESESKVQGIDFEELKTLRKKLISLAEENNSLRQEVHNMKAKFEQIKKIAA